MWVTWLLPVRAGNYACVIPTNDYAPIIMKYARSILYDWNESIDLSNLINSTVIFKQQSFGENCCESMFENCTKIKVAPILYNKCNIPVGCYKNMFKGCINLQYLIDCVPTIGYGGYSTSSSAYNGIVADTQIGILITNFDIQNLPSNWYVYVQSDLISQVQNVTGNYF